MGASTVKWTNHDPYIGLSESDLELYTNFELYKEVNYKHSKKSICKSKQFMLTKSFQEQYKYFRRWHK